jgi:hypothetical protein
VATISRKDIEKGVARLILEDFMGRNGAFNYLAEDAI